MTRLAALRQLVTAPRERDMGRIGYRVLYAKPDGRERICYVARVLRSVLPRRAA